MVGMEQTMADIPPEEKDELDEVVEELGGKVEKTSDGRTIHSFPEDEPRESES